MKKLKRKGMTAAGIISAALLFTGCSDPSSLPSFEVSDNELEDVYGPPPGDPYVDEEEEIEEDYIPGDNVADPMYGPPPGASEPEAAVEEDGMISIETFEEEANELPAVYGPPPGE